MSDIFCGIYKKENIKDFMSMQPEFFFHLFVCLFFFFAIILLLLFHFCFLVFVFVFSSQ